MGQINRLKRKANAITTPRFTLRAKFQSVDPLTHTGSTTNQIPFPGPITSPNLALSSPHLALGFLSLIFIAPGLPERLFFTFPKKVPSFYFPPPFLDSIRAQLLRD